MDGESQLDTLMARLRAVDQIGHAIATGARAGVERVVRATAAAGTTPDGEAWAPTKEGDKALPNAAAAISVVVSGTTKAVLTMVLRPPYVFHQRSKSKGKKGLPRRVVLPEAENGVPAAIADEIEQSAKRELARAMGRR